MMSLSALAAAATVYDYIEDVASDARMSVPAARSAVIQYGIASVDDDGRVTMSERQSWVAARALDNAEGGW